MHNLTKGPLFFSVVISQFWLDFNYNIYSFTKLGFSSATWTYLEYKGPNPPPILILSRIKIINILQIYPPSGYSNTQLWIFAWFSRDFRDSLSVITGITYLGQSIRNSLLLMNWEVERVTVSYLSICNFNIIIVQLYILHILTIGSRVPSQMTSSLLTAV